VLGRLGESFDTSNMNGPGLSGRLRRLKDPSTMEIWREVVGGDLDIGTSAATPLRNSGSITASTEDDEMSDDYRSVTTTLCQILRDEHNLEDIEQQLLSEQRVNHETFAAFCDVVREATEMVRYILLVLIMVCFIRCFITRLTLQKSGYFGRSIFPCG
jgi:hypothetical protein